MKPHYRSRFGFGNSDYIDAFAEKRSLFDEIAKLIESADFLKQRVAYVMTDHLIEVLLNDGLERVIHEYYENMLGPDLDGNNFNNLRRNFDDKLKFFSEELPVKANTKNSFSLLGNFKLSKEEATALGVLHRYRNDMYHREQVNRDVLGVLVRVYVGYTLDIYARFAHAGSVGGINLEEKGISDLTDGKMLNFQSAAQMLKQKIKLKDISSTELGNELVKDANARYAEILRVLYHDLPSSKEPPVQELLANQAIIINDLEFTLQDDKGYRKLLERYKTALRTQDPKGLVEIRQSIHDYQKTAAKTFQTDLSYADLLATKHEIGTIKDDSFDHILTKYYEVDQKLLRYRDRIVQGSIDFDREVQRQIDISRGK